LNAIIQIFVNAILADARRFAHAVRRQWGVENRLHWRLDVVFREDASRIRKRECTSHHDGNSAPVHEST